MERVRFVVCGLLFALGLLCCPVSALASDGFLGGLEDLVGSREVETTDYEGEYLDGYEPELRVESETPLDRSLGADATTVDYVNDTLDAFNRVQWRNGYQSYVWSIVYLLSNAGTGLVVGVSAGFVFIIWGVRKSIRVLMGSFRKGKASL